MCRGQGERHAVISCHPPPQCRSVGPENPGHVCWLTSAAAGTPGNSIRSTPTREGGVAPGLPGILCHAPTCSPLCPFTLNSWQADLDCWFFQLLFQVIPSWILLLILFKAGPRILWSQLQFHPSFCLIISGKSVCNLSMYPWYAPAIHFDKAEMFNFNAAYKQFQDWTFLLPVISARTFVPHFLLWIEPFHCGFR